MCDSVTMSRLQSQLDSSAQRCAFRTQLSIPVRKRDLKDGTSVCSCRYVIFFVIASSFRFVVFVCGRCGCGAMAFLKKKGTLKMGPIRGSFHGGLDFCFFWDFKLWSFFGEAIHFGMYTSENKHGTQKWRFWRCFSFPNGMIFRFHLNFLGCIYWVPVLAERIVWRLIRAAFFLVTQDGKRLSKLSNLAARVFIYIHIESCMTYCWWKKSCTSWCKLVDISTGDFAVCEARCCEVISLGRGQAEVTFSMESYFTWQGPSRSDFAVCEARCCDKQGKSFHLAGAKQKWLCCLWGKMLWQAWKVISLGRGQAEVTLLSVRQDVVKSMEGHFTGQGPSRSDFAVCEARCCEKHGKSDHLGGPKQKWLCCLWSKMLWKARQVISLGRGQAEVTLLSVRQDVVTSMESHFTWQGPSRSDFAVCEARCCEKHGRSFHWAGAKQKWLCCLWSKMFWKAWKVISLGRGQAEVTLLSVRQDVVNSMESHFTWQGPSRSDFAACEAIGCWQVKCLVTQTGKSLLLGLCQVSSSSSPSTYKFDWGLARQRC